MIEQIEFRVPEENAAAHLPIGLGAKRSSVRVVTVAVGDPLVGRIGRLQDEYRAQGRSFFYGWSIHRQYTTLELESAPFVHVWPSRTFEPAGEECGTVYNDSNACEYSFEPERAVDVAGHTAVIPASSCGSGSVQRGPLYLSRKAIPKDTDFSVTIAGELVVSSAVVALVQQYALTGAAFGPVRFSGAGTASDRHFQLIIKGEAVDLAPETRAGRDPFDSSDFGRCPLGHVLGLNLLSEVFIRMPAPSADILQSKQLIGVRRGLLRPRPLMLLTQAMWQAICRAGLTGLHVEVARPG